MSAIAGIFHHDGELVQGRDLRQMTAILDRLGQSETFWVDGPVGFGHRLSCFTSEDHWENQPLTSRDGRLTLVVAGRIDNRPELSEALRISLTEAAQLPDSAFIMAALEKWGDECPSHLVGSYALAAFDRRSGTLLLARSPRGQHSLYYWTNGTRTAFASAPAALFAFSGAPREVNLRRLADHLLTLPPEPESTWYRGIAFVEAGSSLLVRRSGITPRRFWQLNTARKIRFRSDSEYVEAFASLWDRVVVDHMRSRTGPGILMSGGLDSTSVAAVAAASLNRIDRRLATFTDVPPPGFDGAVPPGWYPDETPFVRAMARKYSNIDLNFVTPENRFFLDGVEEYFAAAESPFRAGMNRLWAEAIFRAAGEQGLSVLLDGQAGNLTISWYGSHLLRQLIFQGRWPQALREARGLVRTGVARSVPAALASNLVTFLPGPMWAAALRARYPNNPAFSGTAPWKIRALITPEFAREQRVIERARQLGSDFRFRPRRDMRARVLGPPMGEGDAHRAIEARFGIQLRSPAADPRIVEFCLAIPEDQFQRNGVTRWLIKRAMQGRLPDEVLNNRLRGFQSAAWFEKLGPGSERLNQELSSLEGSALVSSVIDLSRIRGLLSRIRTDHKAPDASFWRTAIETSLVAGRFLRWTEKGYE